MIASVARYYNMDEMTRTFLEAHHVCNIVNLGCGLETAYYRIGSKTAIFYEVDLPQVIEHRRRILGTGENEKSFQREVEGRREENGGGIFPQISWYRVRMKDLNSKIKILP